MPNLTRQDITCEQYSTVIEPMYHSIKSMTKQKFIEFLMPSITALAKQNKAKKNEDLPIVFIGSVYDKTQNNCYYIGNYAKVLDKNTDIATGITTVKVRELTVEEQKATGWDEGMSYHIDYHTNDPRIKIVWQKAETN